MLKLKIINKNILETFICIIKFFIIKDLVNKNILIVDGILLKKYLILLKY